MQIEAAFLSSVLNELLDGQADVADDSLQENG